MMYINSDTALYIQHERWRASEGGRATEGERYICMYTAIQQYLQWYLYFFGISCDGLAGSLIGSL